MDKIQLDRLHNRTKDIKTENTKLSRTTQSYNDKNEEVIKIDL